VDMLANAGVELPTPLPPDRPLDAAPAELYEAAQEFLTDWLVREKFDEAMHFMSERVIACINIDESADDELLALQDAIIEMRQIMRAAVETLPDRDNLTEAIDSVPPRNEDQAERIEEHPFGGDFTIIQVPNQVANSFSCNAQRGLEDIEMPGGPDALGTYWGVILRFKARDDLGGALGFLWDRLEGEWKISSYDLIPY